MRLAFAERRLLRSSINDACHNGNGASHPDFIESSPVHVIGIVRPCFKSKSFTWTAKSSSSIALQKLKYAVILVDAIVEYRSRRASGTINHILLRILVQFVREN